MVIYLDVLLLVNFVMNFFILVVTAQTIKIKINFKYGILAATLGSLYVITLLIPKLYILTSIPFIIIIALLMILITFRKRNFLFNIKTTLIYMLYAMLIGGMCFFLGTRTLPKNSQTTSPYFPYEKLILSLMIIYTIIYRLIIYVKDRKELTQLIFSVEIFVNKDTKIVKAFLDTGNELREPATNLPVLIVEKNIFSNINLTQYDKFYIPYKVVNGAKGQLLGFMPSYITININGEIQKRNVIVAFSDTKLSNLSDYDALLSRGII